MDTEDKGQSTSTQTRPTPPAELSDKRLPKPPTTPPTQDTLSEARVASPSAGNERPEQQARFSLAIHQYLSEYIRFADQKAGFTFAATSGFLALTFKTVIHDKWLVGLSSWGLLECMAFAATLLTCISILLAVAVVLPRLPSEQKGLIYWGSIARFETAGSYVEAILRLDLTDIVAYLAEHNHVLARIAHRKYTLLTLAMWFGLAGLFAGTIFFVSR